MTYKKIPNLKEINGRYYWRASGWYRNFTNITSKALGSDKDKAIKKCLDINKNTLLQNELEFLSFEYVLEYCQSKFIWWALKSDNRKKVFMSWFNYLGNKTFKDKPFKKYKITELKSDDVEEFYLKLTNVNYKENTGNSLTSYKEAFDIYKELIDQCLRVELFVESGLKINPFKFKRIRSGKETIHANEESLNLVIAECIRQDKLILGLAFLVTFYWNVRLIDIITRFKWSMYKKNKSALLPMFKNHKDILQPISLIDNHGNLLYPEIENYIDKLPSQLKIGIFMIQQKGTRKGVRRPYTYKTFNTYTRQIRKDVNLPKEITFASFRHGGITNLAESGASESEIKASTKHKNTQSLKPYIHQTAVLQISGQQKRLAKKHK
jgi:hypothetical protein